ncbi:hypothetical protein [Streptomyces herbicida]|uniref:hypothetical protein n=1 Tax=Streptomyces herbicida TaxID=3065675 RepID=UPI00292CEE43|nr:hypothetical protein [Streptomyces sp. NEAU-HV9]
MNPEGAARQLFHELLDHEGPDACATVVEPWLTRAGDGYRGLLATAPGVLTAPACDGPDERRRDLVWELYALSRVSDVLLLSFQPPGYDGWAGPGVTMDQYLGLFARLGAVPFEETAVFDPFRHEIVEVEQADDPDQPVRITEVVWPGLWLGPVLFGRAGVRVRAGVHHAERGVADRSPLYWTFRRRHRPTVDLSQGWGHNSQWRTDFRVDLRTGAGDRVNTEGSAHVDAVEDGTSEALLTPAERRDLLRRCLVRTPVNAAALATDPRWAEDLFPFDWHMES